MATKPRSDATSGATDGPTDGPTDGSADGLGEFRGAPQMHVAVISGATFQNRTVTYYDVDGVAIVEGDIALGAVEDVEAAMGRARGVVTADPTVAFSVGITGSQFRWPGCRMPYEIDPNLPNQQRVTDAIAHWEARTAFRFPLRTAANAASHPNWVRFTDAGGCWSMVGMQGGQQTISLGPDCSLGNTIHEIGHAVGLWHEQSREDRDLFVTINWQNIQSGMAAQFNQHITDGDDFGPYDYGSIMHYPRWAFSRNGQDTITPTDPNAQIGQREQLSPGDVAGVRQMYPGCGVLPKPPWREPGGFKKVVDDRPPFKKIRDDQPFKKISDDPVVGKPLRDPSPKLDPMPLPRFGSPSAPTGGLLPFAMATPHHASVVPGGVDPTTTEDAAMGHYLQSLQRQVLEVDAARAQAQAAAAQAALEVARLQDVGDALAEAYTQAIGAVGGGQ